MDVPELTEIQKLRGAVLDKYDRTVKPLWPRIAVNVLGREIKIGHIWLPDGQIKQQKPVEEGIVIGVYEPVSRVINKCEIWYEPQVKVGDHVLFPHWAGDQKGLRDGDVRFIPEVEIIALVEYERRPDEPVTPKTISGFGR